MSDYFQFYLRFVDQEKGHQDAKCLSISPMSESHRTAILADILLVCELGNQPVIPPSGTPDCTSAGQQAWQASAVLHSAKRSH